MSRVVLCLVVGLVCILLGWCSCSPAIAPAVRSDLAPTGKLRAGINYANSIIATKDPVSGELRGVSVDLLREIAQRINVPLELVGFDFSGKMADALIAGEIDVGALAGGTGTGREQISSTSVPTVSPSNGRRPSRHSNAITPIAQMSVR